MLLPEEISEIQGVEIDSCLATVIAEEHTAMNWILAVKDGLEKETPVLV